MSDHTLQLASAIILGDSAVDLLLDTAAVLEDAGETAERQVLSTLAEQASSSVERLRQRKQFIDSAVTCEAANDDKAPDDA
ncbi:MAG TPA: hypothetical protein VKA94_15110 [Hyphomicrobiales bacterium]|nr:hypothetical protein [Hyphomicrobiales bacterium]